MWDRALTDHLRLCLATILLVLMPWEWGLAGSGSVESDKSDHGNHLQSLQKAAQRGDAKAQFELGLIYYEGKGVEKNYAQALNWFRKCAAVEKYGSCQYNLGTMYHWGQGVRKDYVQAFKWKLKAAMQGQPLAQYEVGLMYYEGLGVRKNYAQAFQWFHKAGDHGLAKAQHAVGLMFHEGQGVKKDDAQALNWYRKAADQGYAQSQENLGIMYHEGQGVQKDDAQALQWHQKAAGQGLTTAQEHIDIMYQNGEVHPHTASPKLASAGKVWGTFVQPNSLFSIAYPVLDWAYKINQPFGDFTMFVKFYPSDESARFMVMLNTYYSESSNVDVVANNYKNAMLKNGVAKGKVTIEPLSINGYPARSVSYPALSPRGEPITLTYNIFLVGRYKFALVCAAPVGKYKQYVPVFQHMISSFELHPEALREVLDPNSKPKTLAGPDLMWKKVRESRHDSDEIQCNKIIYQPPPPIKSNINTRILFCAQNGYAYANLVKKGDKFLWDGNCQSNSAGENWKNQIDITKCRTKFYVVP